MVSAQKQHRSSRIYYIKTFAEVASSGPYVVRHEHLKAGLAIFCNLGSTEQNCADSSLEGLPVPQRLSHGLLTGPPPTCKSYFSSRLDPSRKRL